jgi:hypothetical protein
VSNQVLQWLLLIVPWVTLFFMPQEFIKRFMPIAQFSIITSILFVEMGQTLGWFIFGQSAYPLRTPSYIFGLNCVTTMWLFYFFYGRFWRYIAIDMIMNFGFIYLFHVYFLGSRGLFYEVSLNPLLNVVFATIQGALLYAYQIWQEGIFVQTETRRTTSYFTNFEPVNKPLTEGQDKEKDNEQ